uniref:Uncharacterized protein n=1 Tax=Arion vulgaris TaxID=1028688 RepID=A0A0B6ZJ27_9EUPU
MNFLQTSSIESYIDQIPFKATVVFDWDNTLKVTSADRKAITSGLSKESLNTLVQVKQSTLYIISAIRPTRMNMDTLLIEVDKLGLRRYFCPECKREHFSSEVCSHDIKSDIVRDNHPYVCWGNIIICGYDKAEVFLELLEKDDVINDDHQNTQQQKYDSWDEVDGIGNSSLKLQQNFHRDVYFFDDEFVNIENFSQLVKDSTCVFVTK